jgi:hypothetical protein
VTILAETLGIGLNAPDGPNTPFGEGVWMFDVLRLVTLLCLVGIFVVTPFCMARSVTLGQTARLLGAAIILGGAFGTELDHFGDYAHYRLYVNFFGSVVSAWGYWSFFRFEAPSTLRPTKG